MNFNLKQNIIYEDIDFLIVNKPAGLLVHPTKYQKENTLVDFLKKYYPKITVVGEKERPGLVHRLDQDVSGLMVVAKNKKSYESLTGQFKNHQVKKEYLGLTHGCPSQEKGTVDFPLARTKKGKLVAVKYEAPVVERSAFTTGRGKLKMKKRAETKYEVISTCGGSAGGGKKYALLKIEPLTGRTNQIKIHLGAIGCPLVEVADRVFLHASTLGFYDLKGEWRGFKIDLPEELKEFLKK